MSEQSSKISYFLFTLFSKEISCSLEGQSNATTGNGQVDGMTVSVTLDVEFDSALTDPDSAEYQTASAAVIEAFIQVIWRYLRHVQTERRKETLLFIEWNSMILVYLAHRIVIRIVESLRKN